MAIGVLFLWVLPRCTGRMRHQPPERFVRDIPEGLQDLHESIGTIRDSLKLESIDSGFDSIEIAIWTNVNHVQKVFVIKNAKGAWSASFIRFGPVLDKYRDSVVGFRYNVSPVAPRSSWNAFAAQLFGDHILTLPDERKLPKYEIVGDGRHLAVEVATREKYRIYTYTNPEMNERIQEAQDVMSILDLIKNEFGVGLLIREE
jgi:hypothetical protein